MTEYDITVAPLSERERRVLRQFLGFEDGRRKLREIAEGEAVTHQRVWQIKEEARKKVEAWRKYHQEAA